MLQAGLLVSRGRFNARTYIGFFFALYLLFLLLLEAPFPRTHVVISTKLHHLQVSLLLFKNKGPFPRTRAVDAAR